MNLQDTSTTHGLRWALTMLLMLLLSCAQATHLVGGEMYYDHLGADQYEVHLIIYRDCGPTNTNGTGFDLSAAIGVFQGQDLYASGTMDLNFNAVTNIDLLSGNPCAILPPGVCIERAEYVSTLTLPPSDQAYTIVYQRCCRNPQVINLEEAMNTGFTMYAEVPPVNSDPSLDTRSNSSPRFIELPQAYVCQAQPFSINHFAVDPDGDSLHFAIGDVFIGGTFAAPTPNPPTGPPFNNVSWANGYGPYTPLGLDDENALAINPSNGTLTANPATVGKYVIGIIVTEFRQDDTGNWVPLGKVIRDFTIDVVPCELLLPDVEWPAPCTGLELSFNVDADQGAFSWDFGTGMAEDTSSAQNPSHEYTGPGIYTVSLVYDLDGCADSLTEDLAVSQPYSATFSLGPISCTADAWTQPVTFTGDDPGTGTLSWTLDGIKTANGTLPDAFNMDPGDHTIANVLTNEYGCLSTESMPVTLPELPQAAFEMAEPPCNGMEIDFTNLSTGADQFAWVFDTDSPWTGNTEESGQANPTWTYDGFSNYVAQLIAQPGEACADTLLQEVVVLAQNPLVMAFGAIEPLACSLETEVAFYFYGEYADDVTWDFGAAGSATGDTILYDFGESGLFPVTLTIENDTCGTELTTEFEVYVPELVAAVELVLPNVLTPNADGKNDRFRVGTRREDGSVDLANASSFTQFRLQIYDRWGVLVHESAGPGAAWDGRIGGGNAAPGTYYYVLNADHSCLDEDLIEMGEVTLITN